MSIEHNGNAPYASPKNVLDVMERYRHRGLRTPFTLDLMGQIGVPDSTAHRTLQALKLLGLVDDGGEPTEALEALKRANEEEYRPRLAQILRSAYHGIFTVVDPAADSSTAVRDAFRFYKPDSQQHRMVTLFLALCEEAGIIDKGPKKRGRVAKGPGKARPPRRLTTPAPSPVGDAAEVRLGLSASSAELPTGRPTDLHPLIAGLLRELPENGSWTSTRRKRWLAAVESTIDLLYAVPENDSSGVAAKTS